MSLKESYSFDSSLSGNAIDVTTLLKSKKDLGEIKEQPESLTGFNQTHRKADCI